MIPGAKKARLQCLSLLTSVVAVSVGHAQAPAVSDAAKDLVGAWEISNAERDKRCAVTFSTDPAPGGFKLELDPACSSAFPPLKDVVVWKLGPNDRVWLADGKGGAVIEFTEVESGMYEGERKGEGLFFMQTQAAVKAETRSADQLFGDWKLLRELDQPLCTLTLSNTSDGSDKYKIVVKQGCDTAIANFGLTTWRLDRDQLLLTGSGGTWRFTESDPATWERMPLSTDPLLLMRP
jgi:protease inhibitor Inh